MKGLSYYTSPVGILQIESSADAITKVSFVSEPTEPESPSELTTQCVDELEEYFFKGRKFFTVPVDLQGTDFQKKVWNVLTEIPYGETISYEEQSIRVGDVKSIRAVGTANGINPIAIVVPCHRVIGKNGSLVGYGGGLENKEWLLYHEGAMLKQLSLF